ncbi:hypothetical protein PpBr36_07861 [Pyricularia pennisetigena]|uniref:hypothetical protein n=1 Tax=Pyricularia pennisetigena TaxID=1578925 RepID=UPI00114DB79A|nr:hypothetical protein PpBr36_07861 [Pyricularia pennisetigena]TLS26053.1 hypothetical protein PpBr36_07861 [Pyricularia pennisetigena]
MNLFQLICDIICDILSSLIFPHARENELSLLNQLIDLEQSTYDDYHSKLVDMGMDWKERFELSGMRRPASETFTSGLRKDSGSWRTTRDVRARYVDDLKELNRDLHRRLDERGGYQGRRGMERPDKV